MRFAATLWISLLAWHGAAGARAQVDSDLERASALIDGGEYRKGAALLLRVARSAEPGSARWLDSTLRLADFHENLSGHYDLAQTYYERIVRSGVPADDRRRKAAAGGIGRIASLRDRYRETDAELDGLRNRTLGTADAAERSAWIGKLESLIRRHPGYYRLPEAHFYLGLNQAALGRYGEALDLFDSCIRKWPAADSHLGVSYNAGLVRRQRLRLLVGEAAWGVVLAFLLVAAAAFYASRPWKWMGMRHLLPFFAAVALWWMVFNGSQLLLARWFESAREMGGREKSHQYLSARPDSPGSEAADPLFEYGLAGIGGLFLLAAGASRSRRRRTATAATGVAGLVLFSSLTAIYYLRHCEGMAEHRSGGAGLSALLGGHLRFPVREPELFILTDPGSYPDLDVGEARGEFRRWLIDHRPSAGPGEGASR